jgi:hypothetical protein
MGQIMKRQNQFYLSLVFISLLFCVSYATVGQTFFDTMSVNKWIQLPVVADTLKFGNFNYVTPPFRQAHANITIDYKNRKIIHWGNDTHGLSWGDQYFNIARIFDLESFTWDISHVPDSFNLYSFKHLGKSHDTAYYVPITTTGRPVASHSFDAPRYIPETDNILINYYPGHSNADYFTSAEGLLYKDTNAVLKHLSSCWLYNTVTKVWQNLNVLGGNYSNTFSGSIVYDSKRNRLLTVVNKEDLWAFSPDSLKWSYVTGFPSKVTDLDYDYSCEYDTYQDKILLLQWGKNLFEYSIATNTWEWVDKDTNRVQPPRTASPTAYDTLNKCLVRVTATSVGQTWVYDSKTRNWIDIGIPSPPSINEGREFRMDYDPVTNATIYVEANSWSERIKLWALKYRPEGTSASHVVNEQSIADLTLFPNPFNPTTRISMQLSHPVAQRVVSLNVFDIKGRMVDDLTPCIRFNKSGTEIYASWNAAEFSNSVYIVKATVGTTVLTKRIFFTR